MRSVRIVVQLCLVSGALAASAMLCQEAQEASKEPVTPPLPVKHRDLRVAIQPAARGGPQTPPTFPIGDSPTLPSLFDGLANHFEPVTVAIEVRNLRPELKTNLSAPFVAGGEEVTQSAGTFGDVSRFLQTVPGVVSKYDLSNEIMVRGGHSIENLFLVDGVVVPNINHGAIFGTTGGFAPMIDSGAVQGATLFTGGYGAEYPDRLSSVTEIRTLDEPELGTRTEADFGIQGLGGLREQRIGGGDLLFSAHQSTKNLLPGYQGEEVRPTYTNGLFRFRRNLASGNQYSILNVSGHDSVQVSPCLSDEGEASSINSQYSGWRETTGFEFTNPISETERLVVTASDSEQISHINQQEQVLNPTDAAYSACPIAAGIIPTFPVYGEDSNDSSSTAAMRYEWATSKFALTGGTQYWVFHPQYQIDEPNGLYSPYSATPTDLPSFGSYRLTGQFDGYLQIAAHPTNALTVGAGVRIQTESALPAPGNNGLLLTPRFSLHYRLTTSMGVHLAYAQYGQVPPIVYQEVPQNQLTRFMRVDHEIVGADFDFIPGSQIHVEAYKKSYTGIPASIEYPSITMNDMIEMLGQQIVWLPMSSGGSGTSSGIELSDFMLIRSNFALRGSVAYARAKFAGLDKILRPGNYDFPWIVNVAALQRLGHGFEISSRYGYSTGRPYTPFNMADSQAQDRPIYDLTSMNTLRAPYFSRLDVQVSKDLLVHSRHLELYGGVENILNRQNFLSYVWMPFYTNNNPIKELHQMPIFPNFGARFILK